MELTELKLDFEKLNFYKTAEIFDEFFPELAVRHEFISQRQLHNRVIHMEAKVLEKNKF